MPLVHECADPDCHVVTMGAFCIDHERDSFAPSDADLPEPISNAAAQSRAGRMPPIGDSHARRTRRPLRVAPTSPRWATHPR
jgi:hypothetical protein